MTKGKADPGASKALQTVKQYCGYTSQLEILGTSDAIIHGARGIVEYDDNLIRINMANYELRIVGLDLTLKCLSPECLEITGKIKNLELIQ
ncbi:MAG: YabP/YqfC family sporulation protein [Oscillospiraceae bacterium]